jgi:hypothetical protein
MMGCRSHHENYGPLAVPQRADYLVRSRTTLAPGGDGKGLWIIMPSNERENGVPERLSPDLSTISPQKKSLTPAAQRALAEAAERRAQAAAQNPARPPEFDGPKGPEPTRYGDWERKGIASDF